MSKYIYSIIRQREYRNLASMHINGEILDVGGSKHSGYHELLKGEHTFHVINIDPTYGADTVVDIEKKFPFPDNQFDGAICLNVLEHVFDFQNAFGETVRTVKSGGTLVFATPFMHHIHGSPDDYMRYTPSSYRRLAEKFGCEVVSITPLGGGFFSLGYQCIGGALPTHWLRAVFRQIASCLDRVGAVFSSRYRSLSERLPLGYFVVMKKRE